MHQKHIVEQIQDLELYIFVHSDQSVTGRKLFQFIVCLLLICISKFLFSTDGTNNLPLITASFKESFSSNFKDYVSHVR